MLPGLLSSFTRYARRVPRRGWKVLTGKQQPRRYRGKGAMKTGMHTSKGHFLPMPSMMPNYVVPDLTGFSLKPYVAHHVKREAASDDKAPGGRSS